MVPTSMDHEAEAHATPTAGTTIIHYFLTFHQVSMVVGFFFYL